MLADARELKRIVLNSGEPVKLVMNDRVDLCVAAGFDGVHLGQDDLSVEGAHSICRQPILIGVSTHNPAQVKIADQTSADYIAIGPVFQTSSKANPDPVIGLEGIRAARKLTQKPLVAIGGINRENCTQVIEAGADSVAVISDLIRNPAESAKYLLKLLT
jgi:thiamine-phosphate pyrophosphorylase